MEVIAEHCILGHQAKPIGFGHISNDFCKVCREEEEKETVHMQLSRKKSTLKSHWQTIHCGTKRFQYKTLNDSKGK